MNWIAGLFGKNGGAAPPGSPASQAKGNDMTNANKDAPNMQGPDPVSGTELVTPQKARHWRETEHFERQRKISDSNVLRLADEMRAGRFIPGTQIYKCVLPDGSKRVINGNHTLEAVSESGVPQFFTITQKRVRDLNEAGRLYAVFDIHKARSWLDSLRATGQENSVDMAQQVLAAIGVIENKFAQHGNPAARSRLERLGRLEDYSESARLLSAACSGAPAETQRYVKRAAIMAVALETLRYQPSMATEFWYRLVHDDGLRTKQPERALLTWLRNFRQTTGTGARRQMVRATALAWNAVFRGEEREYVKPNQMGAFYLLGTPWANGLGE